MKFISRLIIILGFISILSLVIAYARGYRLDLQKKLVTSTGILAISSSPKAAKVYINDELKGVTDINITLPPANYKIEIKKDGYTNCIKPVSLKGELVVSIDCLLFPSNPSLSPLTNLGVFKAVSLDQTDRILIFTENNPGIYLYEAGKKPLSLLSPLKLILLKKNLPAEIDFKTADVSLSPDFKQAIVEFKISNLIPIKSGQISNIAYLLSLEEENTNLFDVTTSKDTLLEAWNKQRDSDYQKILETFPKDIAKIASDSFHIVSFSANETKLLYQAKTNSVLPLLINPPLIASNQTTDVRTLKKDRLYVYDRKEDKNFEISNFKFQISNSIFWYPDSKHLSFTESNKVTVIDYDGNNKQVVYSGPFENSFFNVTGDGNLVILANLNPETNKYPDLYAVGIR